MVFMSSLQQRIEQRLHERIEAAESSPSSQGKLDTVPLFSRLTDVVNAVGSIRDYSVEPYRAKVRQVVCASCRQDGEGRCATRERGQCGLERHFELVVATVEDELKSD